MVKVLIVDDNEDVTYSLDKSLKSLNKGYETEIANSGEECLQKVEADRPDIVLLDIMMPDMDGWEVAEKLQPKHIPILFITGKADMLNERKDTLDIIEYMMKPIKIEELDARIRKMLGN